MRLFGLPTRSLIGFACPCLPPYRDDAGGSPTLGTSGRGKRHPNRQAGARVSWPISKPVKRIPTNSKASSGAQLLGKTLVPTVSCRNPSFKELAETYKDRNVVFGAFRWTKVSGPSNAFIALKNELPPC